MSFFHRATRSSSNSNDDGNVKNARKWHHKSDDDDIDVVKVKELPPKILKNAKKHGKKCKQKEESSYESDSSDAESQSEYCPGGSSYYEDDEPVDKPKKVTKKAKCKIKINTVKVAESSSDENSSESLDSPVSKCKKKKEKCKLQPKKGSKAVVPQNVK